MIMYGNKIIPVWERNFQSGQGTSDDRQCPPNEEGVAICLCSFTATSFVTQESVGLLLLPQSDFVKTLRVKFT